MDVLTEGSLRTELRNKEISRYLVKKGTIITPSARQYLNERKIELVIEEEEQGEQQSAEKDKPVQPISDNSSSSNKNKLEHMTHLQGNKLVCKDHPRIEFRGKLDSLQSKILELQLLASRFKADKLVSNLDEVLNFVRNILRAEVLEEDFPQIELFGLKEQELREMSHNPKHYFETEHITPSFEMGEILLGLNAIRTSVRETEIKGIKAFRKQNVIERQDIIQGLNRLSSAVYILMLRWQTGFYKG